MSSNQSHNPSQLSDDHIVHFDPSQVSDSERPRSNNFVDESETSLFDFDLADLENLFNSSETVPSHSTSPLSLMAETLPSTDLSSDTTTPIIEENIITPPASSEFITQPAVPPIETFSTPIPTNDSLLEPAVVAGTATALATSHLATNPEDKPNGKKKGFFSQFDSKKPKSPPIIPNITSSTAELPTTPASSIIASKKPTKNNKSLLILLGIIGLGALAWLASQFLADPEPESAPKPPPVAKVTTPPATPPTSAVLATPSPVPASSVTAPITNPAVTQSTVQTTTQSTVNATKNTIKPEEILSAPLPKDNAVAKEEIDRLADQSKQLSQQEKMIEEQLKMMNELNAKKEERIAILEKQIAQAEAQKSQAKK